MEIKSFPIKELSKINSMVKSFLSIDMLKTVDQIESEFDKYVISINDFQKFLKDQYKSSYPALMVNDLRMTKDLRELHIMTQFAQDPEINFNTEDAPYWTLDIQTGHISIKITDSLAIKRSLERAKSRNW